jgi:hypothetical protein
LDIIDVDLGMYLDSIFISEMQIDVGHEHSERRLQCRTAPTARHAGP